MSVKGQIYCMCQVKTKQYNILKAMLFSFTIGPKSYFRLDFRMCENLICIVDIYLQYIYSYHLQFTHKNSNKYTMYISMEMSHTVIHFFWFSIPLLYFFIIILPMCHMLCKHDIFGSINAMSHFHGLATKIVKI